MSESVPEMSGMRTENDLCSQTAQVVLFSWKRKSILALPCCLSFLLALDTGLLVMLTLANLGQYAGPGTLALKTLESALKGFVFPNADFRHCFPSPRANRDATPGIF